jgi:hypothetical protein
VPLFAPSSFIFLALWQAPLACVLMAGARRRARAFVKD